MKEKINNIIEDPKKKAYLFFGFYLILFIAIIYTLRSIDRTKVNKPYETSSSLSYDATFLKENNYSYNYKIVLDDVVYEYNGKRKGNTELFTYNGIEYYKNNDSYFVNNGIWVKGDNPYRYTEFLDIENLITMIDSSFFEAKVSYYNDEVSYRLLISTNTINKNIKNVNSDFDEVPNNIEVYTSDGKNMNGVSLSLDSYCKLNNLCQKSLKIDIKYSNIGEISDIKNPINM